MTLRCINKYISATALKWSVAGCASKWTTFFTADKQLMCWSLSAASVQNSQSLILSFVYIFLCYLMKCYKRIQCVPIADLDLFNHWQSESIQSFGLLVFHINATDGLLEHVSQLPQQCEKPETGSTARGLSHTLFIEFNSSWAAKTPYQSCGSVSWGECTLATDAWILSANAGCTVGRAQGQGAKLDTWLSQYEHSETETISALAHTS